MNKLLVVAISSFVFLIGLSACSYEDMAAKFIPEEESKWAEEYISKLRDRDFEYVKSKLSEELKPKVTDELLLNMVAHFRTGELVSTNIIGSQVHVFNGVWQGNFTFELQFSDGWNLANAAFKKVNGEPEVIGINVYRTEASQKEINAFTFSGKSAVHFVVLVLAIVVPVFILITTIVCVRTPIQKRKWLWIIFILLGVSAIQLNWTTGQFGVQLIGVHLFGAAATSAGPYAPWVLSASIPLGAIIFWFRRKKFIALAEEANNGG